MENSYGGTNIVNAWKKQLKVSPRRYDWEPLRSHWTITGHPEQARIDAFLRIPSRHSR